VISKARELQEKFQNYYQSNQKKVRIIAIAVIALGVFSYGAIEFTSRPGFCYSCHEMRPAWDNWKESVHAEVTCYDCHMPPGFINVLLHKPESIKELYLHFTVYNKPGAPPIKAHKREPVNEACSRCHSLNRTMAFGGGLHVPHQLHIDQGLSCPRCHARVVHGEEKDRKPRMEICLECHDGKKAPDKCGVCHTKMATPENHKQTNWLQVHGQTSKSMDCQKCHNWKPDWCMDCHTKKPKSHEVKWRSKHGAVAKDSRAGCNACHKLDFCMRCHGIQP